MPAAHTPGPALLCRTAHVSHSQGGWFSHGPLFPGDPDTLTQPPGEELTCAGKILANPTGLALQLPVFAVSPSEGHANQEWLLEGLNPP